MGDATTQFFDAMAASYDELEPWYEHLYAELHRILRPGGIAPDGTMTRFTWSLGATEATASRR